MSTVPGSGPLRLGLVGAGAVAHSHLEAVRLVPHLFTVTAIADPEHTRAHALGRRVGARVFSSHLELATSSLVDAVIVGSPHAFHPEHAIDLLRLGLPVLVEKPMALTTADCAQMVNAADLTGVPLAVGHLQRFMPLIAAAREIIDSGTLGRPLALTDTVASRYERGERPDWFFDSATAGLGILANIGSHALDRVMVLGGESELRFEAAWLHSDRVPVAGLAMGRLGSGIAFSLTLHGTGFATTERTEIACENGEVSVSLEHGLVVQRAGKTVRHEPMDEQYSVQGFVAQLEDFHHAARTGSAPTVSGRYGMAIVEAMEAFASVAIA